MARSSMGSVTSIEPTRNYLVKSYSGETINRICYLVIEKTEFFLYFGGSCFFTYIKHQNLAKQNFEAQKEALLIIGFASSLIS